MWTESEFLPDFILKKVFNFYINSSLHVALAVVAFSLVTYLNFSLALDYHLLLFIFLSTITGYNFIKYAGLAKFRLLSFSNNLIAIQILSLLALTGVIIALFYLSVPVIIASGILGFFTLLYAFPISINYRNLRGIPGLKIYVIAFVVAGVTVFLPLINAGVFPVIDHVIDFIQRSIIAFVLILPFEIRDMEKDTEELGTIPQKFGIPGTRLLGYLSTGVFISMELLKREIYLAHTISLIFLGIIAVVFLKKSTVDQDEYFASFWVEAVPWFWVVLFYIISVFI